MSLTYQNSTGHWGMLDSNQDLKSTIAYCMLPSSSSCFQPNLNVLGSGDTCTDSAPQTRIEKPCLAMLPKRSSILTYTIIGCSKYWIGSQVSILSYYNSSIYVKIYGLGKGIKPPSPSDSSTIWFWKKQASVSFEEPLKKA